MARRTMPRRPPLLGPFFTVPWAPGFEREQLTRPVYIGLRTTAQIYQLGIAKGFARATVKAHLSKDPRSSVDVLTVDLGLLEPECSYLAAEFSP